ncbi:MAG: N-6 DNA methylase [Nitrospirae bacterium]|uniref:type ISP restriction/modification enzyme n=1 Tax=Candidatus Magnetobacterium casense TaxID=1455061 RepID=UPI00058FB4E7|nr:type ISP restriction/modification enzyme [Candidatus Magnetobacterium casensis]MBF0336768.1 N-6 DNA methylase [Nitrospirota bacterium]
MFDKYITEINHLYRAGNATEHSYRLALQVLLTHLLKDVHVTNEPKRQKCGAPDYILTRRKIDIGYIEAKDIGVDLDRVERGSKDDDQWKRYTESLDNIILTDYLEFRFFMNGQRVEQIRIAQATSSGIVPQPENFMRLKNLLADFAAFQGQTIKSAKKLAEMMARKSALMRDVFFKAVTDESTEECSLKDQLKAFQEVLVRYMDAAQFADVYAQTIAYGLFTARLHDNSVRDFSRSDALTLIPKSNPFLRQLFQYVTGPDLDDRVVWIVDALCEVYRAADLHEILKDFGTTTGQNDPVLHFYETFLAEYDPKLRKSRGVWYTPEPVVRFIVGAIDDVLKTHFGIKDGLADTSKINIEADGQADGKFIKVNKEVHKIQLLDVATGTGTFLAEIVKQVYARFKGQEGMWSAYVEQNLLPRLHGFELLMAPYAMCHMKLDLLLTETDYRPTNPVRPPRLSVYLTNSLEEHHNAPLLPFANWLSQEANAAGRIKREMPIMVALGNPPYKGISSNMNSWIARNKIEDYKYVDGVHFNERKHWLNDDYVQFIRLGEHYIEKNGEGILAYITNHGYLDNPTFRGMRWHILSTFDNIYILDLHGNAKKKETTPDGSADKNVFDIQQGVAIIVAIKLQHKGKNKPLAKVHYAELWGSRNIKYDALDNGKLATMPFKVLDIREPLYFFIPQNHDVGSEYQAGFALDELFSTNVTGIVTARDGLVIGFTREELIKKIRSFCDPAKSIHQVRQEFFGGKKEWKYLSGDTRGWKLEIAREKIQNFDHADKIATICYRPFDDRAIYYTPEMVDWGREEIMRHLLSGENVALIVPKQPLEEIGGFLTRNLSAHKTFSAYNINYIFPLYLYNDMQGGIDSRLPNLAPKTYNAIQKIVPDVQPQSLFDYIYAVLHSRAYRRRYAEFLKYDFPRIPYPKDKKAFHALAAKGTELRQLHLMESPALDTLITTYPISGNHEVVAMRLEEAKDKSGLGRVWINPAQYFDNVPLTAWNFYIGGYQPAQKWLKDRKTRKLTSDDILHYQRIIVALTETDKVMNEIDRIDFLPET